MPYSARIFWQLSLLIPLTFLIRVIVAGVNGKRVCGKEAIELDGGSQSALGVYLMGLSEIIDGSQIHCLPRLCSVIREQSLLHVQVFAKGVVQSRHEVMLAEPFHDRDGDSVAESEHHLIGAQARNVVVGRAHKSSVFAWRHPTDSGLTIAHANDCLAR